ncbi:MAG TPA: hypothetical protein VMD59_02145, partial [Acidimicrobiales bacterium]|nr:hypothetical protein [Acidimicrobiales bacterium]
LVAEQACSTACPYGYSASMAVGDIYTIAGDSGSLPAPEEACPTEAANGSPAIAAASLCYPEDAVADGANLVVANSGDDVATLVPGGSGCSSSCPFGFSGTMSPGDIYAIAGDGSSSTGPVTAGTAATSAAVGAPDGLAVSPAGDLVIADSDSDLLDVLPAASCSSPSCTFGSSMTVGDLYTVAGGGDGIGDGGSATAASLGGDSPLGVAMDSSGNFLLVAASGEDRLRVLDLGAPPPPTGLSASTASGEVVLSWTPPVAPPGTVSELAVLRDGTFIADLLASATTFTDGSAEPDVSYSYTLESTGTAGTSSPSNAVSTTLPTPTTTTYPGSVTYTYPYPTSGSLSPDLLLLSTDLALAGERAPVVVYCEDASCIGSFTLVARVAVVTKPKVTKPKPKPKNKHASGTGKGKDHPSLVLETKKPKKPAPKPDKTSSTKTTTKRKTKLEVLGSASFDVPAYSSLSVPIVLNKAGLKLFATASPIRPLHLELEMSLAGTKRTFKVTGT